MSYSTFNSDPPFQAHLLRENQQNSQISTTHVPIVWVGMGLAKVGTRVDTNEILCILNTDRPECEWRKNTPMSRSRNSRND